HRRGTSPRVRRSRRRPHGARPIRREINRLRFNGAGFREVAASYPSPVGRSLAAEAHANPDLRHHHRDSAGPTLPGTHRVLSSSANPNTDNALPFLIVRGLHRAAAEVPPPPRIGGGGAQGEARGCGHDPPEGRRARDRGPTRRRSEEHTSELQSRVDLVCRLLLEKKKTNHLL